MQFNKYTHTHTQFNKYTHTHTHNRLTAGKHAEGRSRPLYYFHAKIFERAAWHDTYDGLYAPETSNACRTQSMRGGTEPRKHTPKRLLLNTKGGTLKRKHEWKRTHVSTDAHASCSGRAPTAGPRKRLAASPRWSPSQSRELSGNFALKKRTRLQPGVEPAAFLTLPLRRTNRSSSISTALITNNNNIRGEGGGGISRHVSLPPYYDG